MQAKSVEVQWQQTEFCSSSSCMASPQSHIFAGPAYPLLEFPTNAAKERGRDVAIFACPNGGKGR